MKVNVDPVTINCTGAVTGPCVKIDSQEMSVFHMDGVQIVQSGSGPALQFQGTGFTPLDNLQGIIPFRMYLSSAVVVPTTNAGQAAVEFSAGDGVVSAYIQIDEINGGDLGINVKPSTAQFARNIIIAPFIHGQFGTSNSVVSFGSAGFGANNATITQNEWHLGVDTPISGKRVFDFFQSRDIVFGHISNMPAAEFGFFFESGSGYAADFNEVFTQGIGNGVSGTGDKSLVAHNRVHYPHTPAISTITCTASPCTFQNVDWMPEKVIVTPGTAVISDISLSGDATTFTTTGQILGAFSLQEGEAIKVTFGAGTAPTMKKIL
jgi:hypothetical protein